MRLLILLFAICGHGLVHAASGSQKICTIGMRSPNVRVYLELMERGLDQGQIPLERLAQMLVQGPIGDPLAQITANAENSSLKLGFEKTVPKMSAAEI